MEQALVPRADRPAEGEQSLVHPASLALHAKGDGHGARNLLRNYVANVLSAQQDPPQTEVPLDRMTQKFHAASFDEKLESIELRNIPYKSQICIQKSLVPQLSTHQKRRFIMITERIKSDDAALIQVKLSSEGIDDFVLGQLCSGMVYNTHLQYLILHNNSITDEGAKRLGGVLRRHPRINTLWLSANKISDVGTRALAKLAAANANVKELNLSNRWPSQVWALKEFELHPHVTYVGAEYLAQALRQKSQLTSLSLADQRVRDDGAALLFDALPDCVLRSLSLSANELTDRCCEPLRQVLALNPILEKLVLSRNLIGDAGAVDIAHGLAANDLLRTLDLSDNRVADKGMVVLGRAVQRNRTVTSLITVGNPSHDLRAELLAATRNTSVFAKAGAWRQSLLVQLASVDQAPGPAGPSQEQREPLPADADADADADTDALALVQTSSSGSPARQRNTRASFADLSASPFKKAARQGSMLVAGVEAHGKKGLTRSVFADTDASTSHTAQPSLLEAIAQAVQAANDQDDSAGAPVRARDARGGGSTGGDDDSVDSGRGGSVEGPRPRSRPQSHARATKRLSQDLGKTLGVPELSHVGVHPIRSKVSDFGDSAQHVLYLRVATEADPADARPTSLVRIGLDHLAERERVMKERQTSEYKKMKANRLKEKPRRLLRETAPPPVSAKFWGYWLKKTELTYPKGIDHTRRCTSTRLDPVRLPPHLLAAAPVRRAGDDADDADDDDDNDHGDLISMHSQANAGSRSVETVGLQKQMQTLVVRPQAIRATAEAQAEGGGENGEGGEGVDEDEDEDEEAKAARAVRAAQVAALQALYDPADPQSPWNRYVAHKEDALKPPEERRLGYYRHLGFSARYFSPGQVLAARRKEKALQLGLVQEDSVKKLEAARHAQATSSAATKAAAQAAAAAARAAERAEDEEEELGGVKGKSAFATTKLTMTVVTSNRLR